MCLTRHQTNIQIQADSYTKQNRYTVEPRYNAVLGITNSFLYPSNSNTWKTTSKCLRKPRHSEQVFPVPWHFAVTLLKLMLGSEDWGKLPRAQGSFFYFLPHASEPNMNFNIF